jgi:lysyl-tRNA synthetase class 2
VDVPYRFRRTAEAASLQEEYAQLEPGADTGVTTTVAGRIMLLRVQGKLAFAELRDSSGAVQLFALAEIGRAHV